MTKLETKLIQWVSDMADRFAEHQSNDLKYMADPMRWALYHLVKEAGHSHEEAYALARLAENGWEEVPE